MDEKPEQPFWRFHLSTAVVISLLLGGILLLNCRGTVVESRFQGEIHYYGWPTYFIQSPSVDILSDKDRREIPTRYFGGVGVLYDLFVAYFVVLICMKVCEYIVNRRGGEKANSP